MTSLGWTAKTSLEEGICDVYKEFKASVAQETLRG